MCEKVGFFSGKNYPYLVSVFWGVQKKGKNSWKKEFYVLHLGKNTKLQKKVKKKSYEKNKCIHE